MITSPSTAAGSAFLRRGRRAVLRRRRPLAAICAAIAVVAGLQVADPRSVPTEEVVVVARDLPAGTLLTQADVTEAAYADGTAPANLAVDPIGEVLASPLRRGEPVTDVRLIGPSLTQGRPDLTALPVRLPDSGMADLLAVGDIIDLVAVDPQGGEAGAIARDVEVLAMPAPDDADGSGFSGGTSGLSGSLVILGVDASDVAQITASAVRSYVTFTWASR